MPLSCQTVHWDSSLTSYNSMAHVELWLNNDIWTIHTVQAWSPQWREVKYDENRNKQTKKP